LPPPAELVVTVNVAVLEPALTLTVAGIPIDVSEHFNATSKPPDGAAPLSVTVPETVCPWTTSDGLKVSIAGSTSLTPARTVKDTPPRLAVMLAVWNITAEDAPVTLKLTDEAPAGTSTDVGTLMIVEALLERDTSSPPLGAGPVSVTRADVFEPAATKIGFGAMPLSCAGFTVSVADLVVPPADTEIDAVPWVVTVEVWMVTLVICAPGAIVIVAGTVAMELLLVTATVKPLAGANPINQTVATTVVPPVTDAGDSEMLETDAGLTVIVTDFAIPPNEAEIVVVAVALTIGSWIGSLAEDIPAGITNDVATVAADGFEFEIVTTAPSLGALPLSETVASMVYPPAELVEELIELSANGLTVILADLVVRPSVAEIVPIVLTETADAVNVYVPLVAPAGIVNDDGTETTAELLVRVTRIPLAGATLVRVTVPVSDP
jgi:hypothetical protein